MLVFIKDFHNHMNPYILVGANRLEALAYYVLIVTLLFAMIPIFPLSNGNRVGLEIVVAFILYIVNILFVAIVGLLIAFKANYHRYIPNTVMHWLALVDAKLENVPKQHASDISMENLDHTA